MTPKVLPGTLFSWPDPKETIHFAIVVSVEKSKDSIFYVDPYHIDWTQFGIEDDKVECKYE